MAECTPQQGNAALQLSHTFLIGKVQHKVQLTESTITWQRSDGKGNIAKSQVSIPLTDVLAVKLNEQDEAATKRPPVGFSLHYIKKAPPYIWTHGHVALSAESQEVAAQWTSKLQHLMQPLVTKRPKKLLVFVNPKSGRSKGKQIYFKQCAPLFEICGVETDVIVTERAHHIQEILQDYNLSEVDGIVICGGDGTFSEAFNGLIQRRLKEEGSDPNDMNVPLPQLDTKIGLLPAGTGQGVVQIANGCTNTETAVINVILGETFRYDAFTVHNDNKLVYVGNIVCGYGFFSKVIKDSESNRWMGPMRYVYALLKGVVNLAPFDAEIHYLPAGESVSEGEVAATADADGWKVLKGQYVNISPWPLTMAGETYKPGVLMLLLHRHCSRKQFFSTNMKLAKMDRSWTDDESIDRHDVKAFRIIIPMTPKDGKKAENHGNETEAKEVPLIPYINVDGEAFPLTGDTVHIRVYASVLHVYGHYPQDWMQHISNIMIRKKKAKNNDFGEELSSTSKASDEGIVAPSKLESTQDEQTIDKPTQDEEIKNKTMEDEETKNKPNQDEEATNKPKQDEDNLTKDNAQPNVSHHNEA